MDLPLVIVLDIDGTLIGDIRPQLSLYEIDAAITTKNKKHHLVTSKSLQYSLKYEGIVRPYAIKFIKSMKQHYPQSQFFIYTASEKKWANFLITQLEKAHKVKFHRPLFTRDNCTFVNNEHMKFVSSISPTILKSLKRQYPRLSMRDLDNRMLVIDNNMSIFGPNDQSKVIMCPTYDYKAPENVPGYISKYMYDAYQTEIVNALSKYVTLYNVKNYLDFQRQFYTFYVQYLTTIEKYNSSQMHDRFFYVLWNVMTKNNISNFSPKVVQYISNKVMRRLAPKESMAIS